MNHRGIVRKTFRILFSNGQTFLRSMKKGPRSYARIVKGITFTVKLITFNTFITLSYIPSGFFFLFKYLGMRQISVQSSFPGWIRSNRRVD